MPLTLTHKHEFQRSVLVNEAIIGHVRDVLNTYVNKPGFSRFYIGITSDLETRRIEHERKKPVFKLMCPIYGESNPKSDIAFHALERDVINALRGGISNPDDPSRSMVCDNGAGGSMPKSWLYVLIG